MKRMRIVGLCLVAVFAFSAVVAANAFAEAPEFMVCGKAAKSGKLYTGKYNSKTCSTEATEAEQKEGKKNKYEREPYTSAKKKGYKGKNAGTPKNLAIDPLTGKGVAGEIKGATECTKEAVVGEVTGPKTEKWHTVYTNCIGDETPCHTAGASEKKKEIKTEELEGTLVFLNTAHTEVGLRVKGNGPGGLLAQYECEVGIDVHVYGEVLAGPMEGNINSANKDSKVTVSGGALNLQSNIYPEGKHTESEAKQYFEWGAAFEACVKEMIEKGSSKEAAEGACVVKAGGFWESYPEKPVSLISNLAGPAVEATAHEKEVNLPSTQNGVTESKGEAFLVTT